MKIDRKTLEQSLYLVESLSDGNDVALAWPRLTTFADQESLTQKETLYELDQILGIYSPGYAMLSGKKISGSICCLKHLGPLGKASKDVSNLEI